MMQRALILVLLGACHSQHATEEICTRILDRLVDLELHERGYRDPHLLEVHTLDMRKKFSASLKSCIGRPLSRGAAQCIEQAKTTEALIHSCLH